MLEVPNTQCLKTFWVLLQFSSNLEVSPFISLAYWGSKENALHGSSILSSPIPNL